MAFKRRFPRARARRQPGVMNKLEAMYAEELNRRKAAGEIVAWWYEGITFKLAPDCRYTPDFLVQLDNGELELHETKGFWKDDARVKIKVAAAKFPLFVWCGITKKKGIWEREDFDAE